MSTQKGNASRTRPQKHKNRTAFKNNLHDTSHQTKFINSISVSNVCQRCKDVIEWKIKYKKYKPLSQPKTCVKCHQKKVKHAYHVICNDCGRNLAVCTKCGESKEVIPEEVPEVEEFKLDREMHLILKTLSERKRRHFKRYMARRTTQDHENLREDLLEKLKALKLSEKNDEDDLDDFDFGDNDSDGNSDEQDTQDCSDSD